MVYKVHITEHASNLLDALASYLLLELQNEQVADRIHIWRTKDTTKQSFLK